MVSTTTIIIIVLGLIGAGIIIWLIFQANKDAKKEVLIINKMQQDKIKEFEGKKYIEFDEAKYIAYSKKRDLIFLLLIGIVIVTIIIAITSLVKNADVIGKDALAIGMEQHGFVNCQCTDVENQVWSSEKGGFVNQYNPFERNQLEQIIEENIGD